MSSTSIPQVGDRLRSYAIERLLGRGGMGVVYRATDVRLGRPVALKLLSDELSRDEGFRARFERESRLAAAIDHAHIVPVYEAGSAGGLLFLAMRYVDGGDLAEVLRREGRLQPGRALALVGQLASALDAAHERGLIHRDVKPSNALIARQSGREHLYLTDFGLTKSAGSHSLTGTGQVMGTVLYMAPEVIRGEEPTAAADQYALGCVLYECLTGHVPYEGANQAAVIYGHLETQPPAPSEHVPGLPRELDAAIQRALAKDPSARWPSCTAMADAARAVLDAGPAPATRRWALPRRALFAGIAAVPALAALVLLATREGGGEKLASLRSDAVAVIDPKGVLRAEVKLDGTPSSVASSGGAVWVADQEGTVSRLDPETNTIRQTVTVGHGPSALAADQNGVWVANRQDGMLSLISADTNPIVDHRRIGGAPTDVCVDHGAVWVADAARHDVLRLDPDTWRRRASALEIPPDRLACGGGAVWASSESRGRVIQINPSSGRTVRTIDIGVGAGALAVGAGAVWVTNGAAGTVSRIDPARGVVTATVPLGREDEPSEVVVGAGGVWVANRQRQTLARIDPGRRAVVRTLQLGNPPQALAIVDGSLWVAVSSAGAGHRGGTLRLQVPIRYTVADLDPGVARTIEADQLLRVTNDGLMAFRHTSDQGGSSLVPNLAAAMPEFSEGGRTLTFTIRRGIRFSTGQPLRPADIKRGIDRAIALGSDDSQLLGTISGVEADDDAGTITVRLRRPDEEILYSLAFTFAYAVPAGTPNEPTKVPLPATGPYRIAQISPRGQVRLERNPYFKSWSAAARPDGYPDAIVLDFEKDDRVALDAVRRGRADWTAAPAFVQGGRGVTAELRRGHARQLHTAVLTATSWIWINTEVAPFNRLGVRRAVALAIDHREIVERHGGPAAARATCRILPASLPGYRDDCPYGQDPDLGRARELVRRSGTRGTRVTVWNAKPWYTGTSRVLARSLRLLGYRVRIKSLPPERYFPAIKNEKSRAQIGTTLWIADYPAPSNFLVGSFSCDERRAPENYGNFCDPVADGLMRRATRLQVTDPRAGNDLWAQADARIIDQAAAIPLYNPITADFVSERLGNYQSHPQWRMLFDQAWVQ